MDYYDRAVAHFTEHPGDIAWAWYSAEPLFAFLSPDRRCAIVLGEDCGCPSMVKSGAFPAWTPYLTEAVRRLDLPAAATGDREEGSLIEVRHLPAFAAAQRLADEMLGRMPPEEKG